MARLHQNWMTAGENRERDLQTEFNRLPEKPIITLESGEEIVEVRIVFYGPPVPKKYPWRRWNRLQKIFGTIRNAIGGLTGPPWLIESLLEYPQARALIPPDKLSKAQGVAERFHCAIEIPALEGIYPKKPPLPTAAGF